jgi:hypothetical protein
LHRVFQTCCGKLSLASDEQSRFCVGRTFMNSLLETRILLPRFLVLYRVCRQFSIPHSLQSQLIDEVIGPGLINCRHTFTSMSLCSYFFISFLED